MNESRKETPLYLDRPNNDESLMEDANLNQNSVSRASPNTSQTNTNNMTENNEVKAVKSEQQLPRA